MSLGSLGLVLVSVTLSAIAQVAFKFGVASTPSSAARALLGPLSVLLSPGVLGGLAIYGIATLLWLAALARVELSQAYPFVGIGFVLTTLAGWWLFDDKITTTRVFGIAFIALGTVLVVRS
jgi:multidrug transporter EmrE-like cation transporter